MADGSAGAGADRAESSEYGPLCGLQQRAHVSRRRIQGHERAVVSEARGLGDDSSDGPHGGARRTFRYRVETVVEADECQALTKSWILSNLLTARSSRISRPIHIFLSCGGIAAIRRAIPLARRVGNR